jgi:hypothetical protein
MPTLYTLPTLLTLRTSARSYLDDQNTTGQYWTNAELNTWINDCLRDIGRRTEDLQELNQSIPAVIGQTKYVLPIDVIRVHRLEFSPVGGNQSVKMELTNHDQMDSVWGYQQNSSQSNWPSYAMFWQTSPITMQVFPAPSQGGNFVVYYFRIPKVLVADADVADIPAGWDDLVPLFVTAMAKLKDKDPTWKDAKAEYEERLGNLVDVSRYWHDQGNSFSTPTSPWMPNWLTGGGGWY